jgi:hypothetical protein
VEINFQETCWGEYALKPTILNIKENKNYQIERDKNVITNAERNVFVAQRSVDVPGSIKRSFTTK